MTDPQRELGLLRSTAADLDTYIVSDILFWSPTDAGPFQHRYPQLTLGGLLLTQAKLRLLGARLSPAEQTCLSEAEQQIAATRSRWRANWEKKAVREIQTRLNAWARTAQERNADDYPSAALQRVMLELLLADVDQGSVAPSHRARLSTLDTLLSNRFRAGPFVLDADLEPAFPPEAYWFLYGRPVSGD